MTENKLDKLGIGLVDMSIEHLSPELQGKMRARQWKLIKPYKQITSETPQDGDEPQSPPTDTHD